MIILQLRKQMTSSLWEKITLIHKGYEIKTGSILSVFFMIVDNPWYHNYVTDDSESYLLTDSVININTLIAIIISSYEPWIESEYNNFTKHWHKNTTIQWRKKKK